DVDDPRKLDWAYDRREWGPQAMENWGTERGPGFVEAARLLDSKVRRINRSVYDLDPDDEGMFDVVLCGALLLHLRDPILGLERMRAVCRGSLVLIEEVDPLLELRSRSVPAAHLAPEPDEWWRANSAGLKRMVELAGFAVQSTSKRFVVGLGPGAPAGHRMPRLNGLLAGQPAKRGVLARVMIAVPR